MRGNPKYKIGDVVKFKVEDKEKIGVVAIIDINGNFFDNSDVSYDIMVKEENCLYKHFMEPFVTEKVGEVDPETVWDK